MKKSFWKLALALVLVIGTLASCATTPATPSTAPSAAPASEAPVAPADPAAPAEPEAPAAEVGPDGRSFVDGKLNERYSLKLVTPTQFNEAIFADYEGFFDEVGIDVEFIGALPQNISLAQAVQTGIVDVFGSGHSTNIALARQAGVKLKIVDAATLDSADFTQTHMTWFTQEGSGIESPADLKGKVIAMSGLGGCEELWNTVFLQQNGLTRDDVEVTVITTALAIEQALRQGQVDVGILHGPNNRVAYEAGGLNILVKSFDIAEKAGDGTLSAVGVRAFTEEFIAEHPAVVKAYIVAVNRAQVWANANYQAALDDAARFLEIDPGLIAGCYYTESLWVEGDKIAFWVQTAEDNKFDGFETPGKVKAEDLYTNDYNPFYLGELTA
jgi:ABC-type nitrate/sulfonate/bicarbonate transport system substrate-binding protein